MSEEDDKREEGIKKVVDLSLKRDRDWEKGNNLRTKEERRVQVLLLCDQIIDNNSEITRTNIELSSATGMREGLMNISYEICSRQYRSIKNFIERPATCHEDENPDQIEQRKLLEAEIEKRLINLNDDIAFCKKKCRVLRQEHYYLRKQYRIWAKDFGLPTELINVSKT